MNPRLSAGALVLILAACALGIAATMGAASIELGDRVVQDTAPMLTPDPSLDGDVEWAAVRPARLPEIDGDAIVRIGGSLIEALAPSE